MAIYSYGKRIPKIDPSAWVFPSADVIGKVSLGKKVYVGAGAVIRGDYGKIIIKDGSAIEENVTIHARLGGTTLIEEDVTVGHAAMIHNCTIRRDAVIGMNSVVTDDVEIGAGVIVAEGAVVKKGSIIPPNSIVAGVPAKIIGQVSEKNKLHWKIAKDLYHQLCADYKRKLKKIE